MVGEEELKITPELSISYEIKISTFKGVPTNIDPIEQCQRKEIYTQNQGNLRIGQTSNTYIYETDFIVLV